MTDAVAEARPAAPTRTGRRARLVAGAASCVSGAALVVHILTGSPLWLVLAGLGFAASLAVVVVTLGDPMARRDLATLARRGVIVGLVGTVAYDSSRWILVQLGGMRLSPFEALPLFGQALLGETRGSLSVTVAGIIYHVLNGVAFGVAYTIWFGNRRWWWGIVFALGLEAFMLALYPGWLDPRSIAELTQVSMVGHFAYGTALGLTATRLVGQQSSIGRNSAAGRFASDTEGA